MATILLNGQERVLPDGEKLNAIQAAAQFGAEVPYYCWHPSLSVVANCRMCEIEVGTKDPKTGEIKMIPRLVPGCQTEAKDGTVIVTDSAKVLEHQRLVMELLLINHPLDCPVCDQAGECGLQDYSYERGQSVHRFVEERVVNPRKEVSDKIQLNQDRCILCTRCVRFTREITRTSELQVIRRGNHGEIDIFPGVPVDNPLAGNVVDLCPVGALLDKDFLHRQRVWYLSKHNGVCASCSTGCNISVEENKGRVWRFKPRHNPHVNDYWICDEGRYSYSAAHAPDLLNACYARTGGALVPIDPVDAAEAVGKAFAGLGAGARAVGVLSPFLTVEEAYAFAKWLKGLDPGHVLAIGPIPVRGEDQTFAPDRRAGRSGDVTFLDPKPFTIHAEKCPNRRGVELVLRHFQGEVIGWDAIRDRIGKGEFQAAYVTSGSPGDWISADEARTIRQGVKLLAVQDSRVSELAQSADWALASATYAEKAGCFVNADHRLQYSEAALPPRSGSLPDLDWFAILADPEVLRQGPPRSSDVLKEAASQIAALNGAASGKLPELGLPLPTDSAEPETNRNGAEPFRDLWMIHKQERVDAL